MPTICNPASLSQLAECFTCFTPAMQGAIRIYLLRKIAGLESMTPDQLAEASKCFACYSEKQQKMIELYLMCQVSQGGSGPSDCNNQQGVGDPT